MKKKVEIVDTNSKADKENRLLEEAFKLFMSKGIKDTSIQDIVDNANVAKGTFYLYFSDKYEIRDVLIIKHSQKLFNSALKKLEKSNITEFAEQIIFIIDYVIDELTKKPLLLQFISKNLGLGIYNKFIATLHSNVNDEKSGVYDLFLKGVAENNIKLENPTVTLFMIIELVSSTCFTCILYKDPLPINEYKPILYKEIRRMLKG